MQPNTFKDPSAAWRTKSRGCSVPGLFLQEFPESYVAGELRDGYGNRIPGRNRLIAYSTTTHVASGTNIGRFRSRKSKSCTSAS
jgi:hypothetical protein